MSGNRQRTVEDILAGRDPDAPPPPIVQNCQAVTQAMLDRLTRARRLREVGCLDAAEDIEADLARAAGIELQKKG